MSVGAFLSALGKSSLCEFQLYKYSPSSLEPGNLLPLQTLKLELGSDVFLSADLYLHSGPISWNKNTKEKKPLSDTILCVKLWSMPPAVMFILVDAAEELSS